MLSFTSAWEDMSYMTELKAVAGSVAKQSRDFVTCSPSPLHSTHLQIHTAQSELNGLSFFQIGGKGLK